MAESSAAIQRKVNSSGTLRSRRQGSTMPRTATPGSRTNRSQENATSLNELSNIRKAPMTKLDEASTTSYTKNLENLRQRALKQL